MRTWATGRRVGGVAVILAVLAGIAAVAGGAAMRRADAAGNSLTPAELGLRNLTQRAYGVPMVQPKALETIWKTWEPEWKSRVNPDDPEQIRRLVWERYGFSEVPSSREQVPMQFVATEKGWVPTCMQCHGGRVPGDGRSMIGLPNTEVDLATFAEDLALSFGMKTDQSRLGQTRGRTNAMIFAVELLRMRTEDLSRRQAPLDLGHYRSADLDAPPWWHVKKKTRLYADGGISGDFVRALMQFTMAGPTGDEIRSWESDFADILAYLRTVEPPKYPWSIDRDQAAEGEKIFVRTCTPCHGTYGPGGKYPNRVVPIEQLGTDPERLTGVPREFREYYNRTWFGERARAELDSAGYIAPPLDGIWASAPYFHNGSVPTVYGVLNPEARPRVFRRVGGPEQYDRRDLGLPVETLREPASAGLAREARRRIVDTSIRGLGNQGHPFGTPLSEQEKRQVIEYLKTL